MGLSCVKQKLPTENINDVKNFLNIASYSKLKGSHEMDDTKFTFNTQVLGFSIFSNCVSNIIGTREANLISVCQTPLSDKDIQDISSKGLFVKFWLKSMKEGFSNVEEVNVKNVLSGRSVKIEKIMNFGKYTIEAHIYFNIGGEYLLKEMMKGDLATVEEYYSSFSFLYQDIYLYNKVLKVKSFNILTYQHIVAFIKESLKEKDKLEKLSQSKRIIDILINLTQEMGQELLDEEILLHESMEDILLPYRISLISKVLEKKKDTIIQKYFHRVYDLGLKGKFSNNFDQDLLAGEIILKNEKGFLEHFTNEDTIKNLKFLSCGNGEASQCFMYLFGYPQIRKLLYKYRKSLNFTEIKYYTEENKENHIYKSMISCEKVNAIQDLLEFEFEVMDQSPDEDNFIYKVARFEGVNFNADNSEEYRHFCNRIEYFLLSALLNQNTFSRLNVNLQFLTNIGLNLMQFIKKVCEQPKNYESVKTSYYHEFPPIIKLLSFKKALNNELIHLFYEEKFKDIFINKFGLDVLTFEIISGNLEDISIINMPDNCKEKLFFFIFENNGYRKEVHDIYNLIKMIDSNHELSEIFVSIATKREKLEIISKEYAYDTLSKLSHIKMFVSFGKENLSLMEEIFKGSSAEGLIKKNFS